MRALPGQMSILGDDVVPPTNGGVTRSKEEALDLLQRMRGQWIETARELAVELLTRRQESGQVAAVTAHDVFTAMEADGCFRGYRGRHNWLGGVFRDRRFIRLGEVQRCSEERNIHQRPVSLWGLRGGGLTREDQVLELVAAAKAAVPLCPEGGARDRLILALRYLTS